MGNIRITSGGYKRRQIKTPGEGTHPMGERERLALFNMILDYVPGAEVIDAYAGSGALGIEALSRGAKKVIFIEKSAMALKTITENCSSLEINGARVKFYKGSVGSFCEANPEVQADLILADPPYDHFDEKEASGLIDYLKPDGIFVLSHPGEAPSFAKTKLIKTQKYASAHISIYLKPYT